MAAVSSFQATVASLHSQPFHVHQMREEFLTRAMAELTQVSESAMALDPGNPLLVQEDLTVQKEYFSKLKFKYLEQEAKEKFLRTVLVDDPQVVLTKDNILLEQSNLKDKQVLKEAKQKLIATREETLATSLQVTQSLSQVNKDIAEANLLMKDMNEMELELARLRAAHPPEERITVSEGRQILDDQVNSLMDTQAAIESSQDEISKTKLEIAKAMKEVDQLGPERSKAEQMAKEAVNAREVGSIQVENICHLYQSFLSMFKKALSIKDISAPSERELIITYMAGPILVLRFQGKVLINVATKGSPSVGNISEITSLAIKNNDVPRLVQDFHLRLSQL